MATSDRFVGELGIAAPQVARCHCCRAPFRTGGCVPGPSCDCYHEWKCGSCLKCNNHCACMTVGRVMLKATRGEKVPESCGESGTCGQCVACAERRLNKLVRALNDFICYYSGTLNTLASTAVGKLTKVLTFREAERQEKERACKRLNVYIAFELALRDPEPMYVSHSDVEY